MSEKENKNVQNEAAENEELNLDELDQVAGGRMRGNVFINKTTDISEDTKRNI